ncbi:SDR family NAD(P)-dependent oxidoreductase [Allokutzneria albata]|uniref:SDR family NAD(P)-dependent oxidoreductase n=1 Tax=Allokutzneria albata TaxID=211114 RepID=UPI0018D2F5AA|nr:SDR family NAD(P)-dependent oxidoreductase [Allokutzneria albata]
MDTHVITSRHLLPLLIARGSGLVVEVTDGNTARYCGFFYDVAKSSLIRLAFAMAAELHPHNVAAVAITPGFLRPEAVLDFLGFTDVDGTQPDFEAHWAKALVTEHGALFDVVVREAVRECVESNLDVTLVRALLALRHLPDEIACGLLRTRLRDENWHVRDQALHAVLVADEDEPANAALEVLPPALAGQRHQRRTAERTAIFAATQRDWSSSGRSASPSWALRAAARNSNGAEATSGSRAGGAVAQGREERVLVGAAAKRRHSQHRWMR